MLLAYWVMLSFMLVTFCIALIFVVVVLAVLGDEGLGLASEESPT